ncbi:endonuclease/exonuclease/phosphatase family protein [Planctellipticum variicoloris]|uniref:endonuclease/exonuclease/phosphatase family protein n=1 Tax=Planctellipticum variicoloris TaxID=3064265 RepID=UPI003013B12F|nr:endonuclease/exonuclease/phosphatase family protein [Planctomycetaceae bacterium SH412]
MLRLLLAAPLVTFLIGDLAAQAPVRTLRVVTYNIHHGLGTDQELNLGRIAEVLRAARPDIVSLQEVDVRTRRTYREDQAAALGTQLGMYVGFGKAITYDEGDFGNCILSKAPIEEFQAYPLTTIAGHEARCVAVARIRIGGIGPQIQFLSTHLDHALEGVRMDQAHSLGKVMSRLPRQPMILAGDMNAAPDSKTLRRLLGSWTDSGPEKGGFTFPAVNPSSRIDYILYRNAPGWKIREQQVIDQTVASDHRPVLTVFEFPDTPENR